MVVELRRVLREAQKGEGRSGVVLPGETHRAGGVVGGVPGRYRACEHKSAAALVNGGETLRALEQETGYRNQRCGAAVYMGMQTELEVTCRVLDRTLWRLNCVTGFPVMWSPYSY